MKFRDLPIATRLLLIALAVVCTIWGGSKPPYTPPAELRKPAPITEAERREALRLEREMLLDRLIPLLDKASNSKLQSILEAAK